MKNSPPVKPLTSMGYSEAFKEILELAPCVDPSINEKNLKERWPSYDMDMFNHELSKHRQSFCDAIQDLQGDKCEVKRFEQLSCEDKTRYIGEILEKNSQMCIEILRLRSLVGDKSHDDLSLLGNLDLKIEINKLKLKKEIITYLEILGKQDVQLNLLPQTEEPRQDILGMTSLNAYVRYYCQKAEKRKQASRITEELQKKKNEYKNSFFNLLKECDPSLKEKKADEVLKTEDDIDLWAKKLKSYNLQQLKELNLLRKQLKFKEITPQGCKIKPEDYKGQLEAHKLQIEIRKYCAVLGKKETHLIDCYPGGVIDISGIRSTRDTLRSSFVSELKKFYPEEIFKETMFEDPAILDARIKQLKEDISDCENALSKMQEIFGFVLQRKTKAELSRNDTLQKHVNELLIPVAMLFLNQNPKGKKLALHPKEVLKLIDSLKTFDTELKISFNKFVNALEQFSKNKNLTKDLQPGSVAYLITEFKAITRGKQYTRDAIIKVVRGSFREFPEGLALNVKDFWEHTAISKMDSWTLILNEKIDAERKMQAEEKQKRSSSRVLLASLSHTPKGKSSENLVEVKKNAVEVVPAQSIPLQDARGAIYNGGMFGLVPIVQSMPNPHEVKPFCDADCAYAGSAPLFMNGACIPQTQQVGESVKIHDAPSAPNYSEIGVSKDLPKHKDVDAPVVAPKEIEKVERVYDSSDEENQGEESAEDNREGRVAELS